VPSLSSLFSEACFLPSQWVGPLQEYFKEQDQTYKITTQANFTDLGMSVDKTLNALAGSIKAKQALTDLVETVDAFKRVHIQRLQTISALGNLLLYSSTFFAGFYLGYILTEVSKDKKTEKNFLRRFTVPISVFMANMLNFDN
jgi:hypothetical protein